jgi:hypothetical protein
VKAVAKRGRAGLARLQDVERLAALRDRADASLADPRPSLTEAEVDAHLQTLLAGVGGGL